jgi:hypothetical protein
MTAVDFVSGFRLSSDSLPAANEQQSERHAILGHASMPYSHKVAMCQKKGTNGGGGTSFNVGGKVPSTEEEVDSTEIATSARNLEISLPMAT